MISFCKRCGKETEHKDYGPRMRPCVICAAERSKRYRATEAGRLSRNLQVKRYYQRNTEKCKAVVRRCLGMPEPTRPNPGLCECCGKPQKQAKRALHIDHCHDTGMFRGWLCHHCNTGLGHFGDKKKGLQQALLYLEKNGTERN